MTTPLTLAEAVPLGTVHLQRLLERAGVRSLAIKGPAFVELGVRQRRTSNDIDLLVHPSDRARATTALEEAGWSIISHWFPPALDDIIYSTTFHHALFPVSLDLHHQFSGLLAKDAFDQLWARRREVEVARQGITTVSLADALITEALNSMKLLERPQRRAAVERVVEAAVEVDATLVATCAETLGASHTARLLIEVLGGPAPLGPPPQGYERWLRRGARNGSRELIRDILVRSPQHAPRVIWEQLTLDPAMARFWAKTHNVPYRSPRQILWVRIRRMLRP